MDNEIFIKKLISLGVLVSKSLDLSVQSIENKDEILANLIDGKYQLIKKMALEIDEYCLKVIALHNPVAIDLRFVVTSIKISKNLEQIGKLTKNIANEGKIVTQNKHLPIPIDFISLSKKVSKMVEDCIFCFVQMDMVFAKKICMSDNQVNFIHKQSYDKVKNAILRDRNNFDMYYSCLSISKHLERIGDLATNIAEDISYMLSGKIIRHKNLDLIELGS